MELAYHETPEDVYPVYSTTDDDDVITNSTYYYYGHPTVEIMCSVLTLITMTAVVGNVLVIVTILNNKHMRTRTNLLLCNLALSDILVGIVDVPFAIMAVLNGDWVFSRALCMFNGYMVGLGVMLSIQTLMWISVHKYISIRNIFKQGLTLGEVFGMITAAWTWALLYNTLTAIGWTSWEFKKGSSQCGPDIPKTFLQITHSITNKTFNFVIPVCVICYCYTKIFTDVRTHLNNLQDFRTVGIKITLLKQKQISATLLTVVVVFFACYTPYIVYSSSLVLMGENAVSRIFNPLAYLCMYLNSACNPMIYALKFPSFRKAFRVILCGSKASTKGSSAYSPRSSFLSSFRKSLRRTKSLPGPGRKASTKNEDYGTNKPSESRRPPKRMNTMPANSRQAPRARDGRPGSSSIVGRKKRISTPRGSSHKDELEKCVFEADMLSDGGPSDDGPDDFNNEVFYEVDMEDHLELSMKDTELSKSRKISISQPNLVYYGELDDLSSPTQLEPKLLASLQVPWTDRSGSEGRIKDLDQMQSTSRNQSRKSSSKIRKIDPLRAWTTSFEPFEAQDMERGPDSLSPGSVNNNRISRMFSGFKRSFNDLFSASFDEDEDIQIPESSYTKYSLQPPVDRESQHLIGHI